MHAIFASSLTLFLIINALGMSPKILTLLQKQTTSCQIKVMLRETAFALFVTLLFSVAGRIFFTWLRVGDATLQLAGGIVLFLIALRMIFPNLRGAEENLECESQHLLFPIAVPLLAGPAVLATAMMQSKYWDNDLYSAAAIVIAYALSACVLLLARTAKDLIGFKGLNALERLMGLILTLLAMQMIMKGIAAFTQEVLGPM